MYCQSDLKEGEQHIQCMDVLGTYCIFIKPHLRQKQRVPALDSINLCIFNRSIDNIFFFRHSLILFTRSMEGPGICSGSHGPCLEDAVTDDMVRK